MRSASLTSSLSSTIRTCAWPSTARAASLGGFERDREEEPAPRSELALDPDPSAVQLDQLARDRETQARAVVGTRWRRVHLRELAENQIVMLRGDADARVAHL